MRFTATLGPVAMRREVSFLSLVRYGRKISNPTDSSVVIGALSEDVTIPERTMEA
jgi:hypothetical protein